MFGINPSDAQRDYIFGRVTARLYADSRLNRVLALKNGNALRKAYFPATRFSERERAGGSRCLVGDYG